MLETIRYHMSHLGDFAGTEARKPYWLWFAFVFVLNIVVSIGLGAVTAAGAASAALSNAGSGEAAVEAAVMEQMLPNLPMLVTVAVGMSALSCVLMGAALVRRLRDGGLPGWLVIVPLIAAVISAWMSIQQLGQLDELMRAAATGRSIEEVERHAALRGLIGWIPLISVVVAGLVPSRSRPTA